MHARTRRIERAIQQAKSRDMHTCVRCGATRDTRPIDGAHLLPRNSPQPEFRADNPEHIMTLCRACHRSYDANKTCGDRVRWLEESGLMRYAEIVSSLYGVQGGDV